MRVRVQKAQRRLTVLDGEAVVFTCRAALGHEPIGAKRAEGDGRTPEGRYRLCLVKENGKYGLSLGLDYPAPEDAQAAFAEGRIDEATLAAVLAARRERRRPPWGSPLGGEIYLHEGETDHDWTQGCIALAPDDMRRLFGLRGEIEWIDIEA